MSFTVQTGIFERVRVADCLDHLLAGSAENRPRATYRLQFHKGFRFSQASALLPYLDSLGISHIYASPILEARPGSTHGYDIVNHNRLNPELGSREEFEQLAAVLRERSMGIVLDVVPNHMGVGNSSPWWQDVLMNGRASRYADFFDIDWDPLKPELQGKLLLPLLGNQYGAELEQGRIEPVFRADSADLVVRYFEHVFPVDPHTIPYLLDGLPGELPPEMQFLLSELRALPPHYTTEPAEAEWRRERVATLLPQMREIFGSEMAMSAVDRAIARCRGTPGDPASFDRLHGFLELQPYRLADWRVSGEEINYRRFFDVNDLVGLRMENPQVFAETHRLIRELLAEGTVQGIRIDHCDGLYNPYQYLVRLQMLYCASQCFGAQPSGPVAENGVEQEVQDAFGEHNWIGRRPPLYSVVEKILEPGEELDCEWPVDGTSGYDFASQVNGIFIDSRAEAAFTSLYQRFLGESVNLEEMIYLSKKLIMKTALAGEVNVLTHMLAAISGRDRRARDLTWMVLRDAIRETIACFPVYRTYVDERGEYTEQDLRHVNVAIGRAKRLNATTASSTFDFLRDILLLKSGRADIPIQAVKHFVLKFQQLTGPVMAKGLEDTVSYVYNRLVSLNEVGSNPGSFGSSVQEFHADNLRRAQRWPWSMTGTSTHDTKRAEDVRARLNVLSEIPRQWRAVALRWQRMHRSQVRTMTDGRTVPDANELYLLYQTLVGIWPWVSEEGTEEDSEDNTEDRSQQNQLIQRAQQYMVKAVHEAKVNLSWINQDPEYVDQLTGFIADILSPGGFSGRNRFVRQMDEFVRVPAYFGALNSIAQVLLRNTAPGNPDLYQGTELWDLSLVDPDNRRPVDYEIRQKVLADLLQRAEEEEVAALCRELLSTLKDGRLKLWTIMRSLRFRRERPELFAEADYVPIYATGQREEHICAFMRKPRRFDSSGAGSSTLLVAAPRLTCTLMKGKLQPPIGPVWENTRFELSGAAPGPLENILTGERLETTPAGELYCRDIFTTLPFALLWGR